MKTWHTAQPCQRATDENYISIWRAIGKFRLETFGYILKRPSHNDDSTSTTTPHTPVQSCLGTICFNTFLTRVDGQRIGKYHSLKRFVRQASVFVLISVGYGLLEMRADETGELD
ncbi:hypothetical protein CEXT_361031 [Caerostris extrusa]|uniref:Uncharacterized protein n=1 Tax=Caerostris extrusa TaxID=172846 RepID=A0AAV4PN95_CAEEX|nr:hypothetical protein CEXT_361031 [Caerostris extrusa]